jgi:hypothetical protein
LDAPLTQFDFSIEAVRVAAHNIKSDKACGPDELSRAFSLYAYSFVYIHLKLLFTLLLSHEIVLGDFGFGTYIRLLKDETGYINAV